MKAHPFGPYLFGHPTRPDEPAWQSSAALTKAFTRHYEALGIQGLFKPLHGFRAGMATLALNDITLPASALRDQLGHTDLQTTLRYYVAGMGDAQLATVDALEGRLLRGRNGGSNGAKNGANGRDQVE